MTRILALIPPDMVTDIGAFQARLKLPTQAEAIRTLLRAALDAYKPAARGVIYPADVRKALAERAAELGAEDEADLMRKLLRITAAAERAAEDRPTPPAKRGFFSFL